MYYNLFILFISFLLLLHIYYYEMNNNLYILIGNSFKKYYKLPTKTLKCKKRKVLYKCIFTNNSNIKYRGTIYNGNRKFPSKTNNSYNIIMTIEKLSQVKFMKAVGEGKNKYYQLAIDYRLFNNKWHISYPIYSDYNIYEFIKSANDNFGNISLFLNRKNIVYIQRVPYYNRHIIVKEIMNYFTVDSYGNDLNNRKWPNIISRKNKVDILKQYKFCIAIENSVITWNNGSKYEASLLNNDYVTEKLTDCLLAGSIPIYFGPKNINLFLPHPNSIINLSSFKTIRDLSIYIHTILNDSNLIQSYTLWHYNTSINWVKRFTKDYYFNYCKICNYII